MSTPVFAPADYLDLKQTDHAAIFHDVIQAWEVLPKLAKYLAEQVSPANFGQMIGDPMIGEHVYIGPDTVIEPGAYIKGPAWIGPNCQIRHGAYIRENVIVGAGSVIGNSCEIKNSILFNHCQVPHFNYVGDSILGARSISPQASSFPISSSPATSLRSASIMPSSPPACANSAR